MRGYHHLTYTDRTIFERYYNAGVSMREIASILGVALSTVYAERDRGLYDCIDSRTYNDIKKYSSSIAQDKADYFSTAKGAPLKLGKHYDFCKLVAHKILKEKKSPDVIVHELRRSGQWTVCTTTLYSYIEHGYIDGVTLADLWDIPRRKSRHNEKIEHTAKAPMGTSIERRPAFINNREELGHWEFDTVIGKSKGKGEALLVLTERISTAEIVIKLHDKTAHSVVLAFDKIERDLLRHGYRFKDVFKSVTVDNGSEFSNFYGMEHGRNGERRTSLYYCHPGHPSERGLNENKNKLVRRFFPKGQSVRNVKAKQCHEAMDYINNLLCRNLNYRTPWEVIQPLFIAAKKIL